MKKEEKQAKFGFLEGMFFHLLAKIILVQQIPLIWTLVCKQKHANFDSRIYWVWNCPVFNDVWNICYFTHYARSWLSKIIRMALFEGSSTIFGLAKFFEVIKKPSFFTKEWHFEKVGVSYIWWVLWEKDLYLWFLHFFHFKHRL